MKWYWIFFPYIFTKSHNIWIIRHCDKPKNRNNPCCSEDGYQRSKYWLPYFQNKINNKEKVQIISSGFNDKYNCIDLSSYTKNSCQKSQRMFLTSHFIYSSMNKTYSVEYINHFCIGDTYKITNFVKNNPFDTIIVWEHNEIIDIIRMFDYKVDDWPNHLKNMYDIIFMMDMTNSLLFYDCYYWVKSQPYKN
jgi:hypothetical protein